MKKTWAEGTKCHDNRKAAVQGHIPHPSKQFEENVKMLLDGLELECLP